MNPTTVKELYRNLPRLEIARLVLRQATRGDVPSIFAYSSDPEVARYLRWGLHQSLADTEAYVNGVLTE